MNRVLAVLRPATDKPDRPTNAACRSRRLREETRVEALRWIAGGHA